MEGSDKVKNSPEYMLGRIMARLESGSKTMERLTSSIKELDDRLDKLPCASNESKINSVLQWRNNIEANNKNKMNQSVQFRHAIWLIIIAAVVSGAVGALTALFSGGG